MKCTKKEMRDKAILLFKENGYESTTVSQICNVCNVTKGSFYNYFKSKNDILLDSYDDIISNHSTLIAALIKERSYKEQLWRVCEFTIDATIDLGPDLTHHMIIADMKQGGKLFCGEMLALKEKSPEYEHLIRTLIISAQENNEIRNTCTPELLQFAYVNSMCGVTLNWSSSGGHYDLKQAVKTLFDVVFA